MSSAVQKFFSPLYKPLCIPQLLRLWPTWFAFLLFQTKEQISNSFANTNLSSSSYSINIWSLSAISSLQKSKCSKRRIAWATTVIGATHIIFLTHLTFILPQSHIETAIQALSLFSHITIKLQEARERLLHFLAFINRNISLEWCRSMLF